jgi:hypothetical protein
MPWGRVDDTLYDHPKLEKLGRNRLAGVGLNTLAVSWCNRFLTDGHVPVAALRKIGGSVVLADALVDAGLWEHEGHDGYLIHDFLDYNESKAQIVAKREAARARMQARRSQELHANNGDTFARSSPEQHANVRENNSGRSREVRDSRLRTRAAAAAVPARPGPNPDPEIPPPPAERGRRAEGTAPRQQGANPRATGDAPRQNGTSPRQEREAQKRGPTSLGAIFAEVTRRGEQPERADELEDVLS